MIVTPLKLFALVPAGLVAVRAHMILNEPTPYGKASLNNSPLSPDGSDYPCKQRAGVYDGADAANTFMALGSAQPLSFTGSAVHGGGSCQVSITYDRRPTKNSVFKVIHSIVGGCPAKGVDGNLASADAAGSGASKYTFSIAADLPTGEATLAWTWFNKVGNREMYMNCAPVTIVATVGQPGGAGKGGGDGGGGGAPGSLTPAFNALPDMFRANIGNGCTTADSKDVDFPNAGDSVDKFGSGPPGAPVGSCGPKATGSGSGSSSSSRGGGTGGAGAVVSGGSIPATTSGSLPSFTGAAGSAAGRRTPSLASPQPTPSTDNSAADGAQGTLTGVCTTEGAFVCLEHGTAFQTCNNGVWSPAMRMAAGRYCTVPSFQSSSAVPPTSQHVEAPPISFIVASTGAYPSTLMYYGSLYVTSLLPIAFVSYVSFYISL